MMIVKLKVQTVVSSLLLIALAIQSCAPPPIEGTDIPRATSTLGEISTWTPRPQELTQTALPTATRPAPISSATTVPRTATEIPRIVATPKIVSVAIKGGNLSVRRGPSRDYNYVGVLYAGETTIATGRDRVSRWIRIALPTTPETEGWITIETDYTLIDGDISNLPYIETEPARPAFIRNCTRHDLWVTPGDVLLLDKFNEPYNEERLPVGIYQIYDSENQENKPIEEVSLSEGKTVDIRYDWTGERSKCE